jgi:hypothetical protein
MEEKKKQALSNRGWKEVTVEELLDLKDGWDKEIAMGYGVMLFRNETDFNDSSSEDGVTEVYEGSITSNYAGIFTTVLGRERLHELYGKTGRESVPILNKAISLLVPPAWGQVEYGHRPPLNASAELTDLLVEAQKFPDGMWWICA